MVKIVPTQILMKLYMKSERKLVSPKAYAAYCHRWTKQFGNKGSQLNLTCQNFAPLKASWWYLIYVVPPLACFSFNSGFLFVILSRFSLFCIWNVNALVNLVSLCYVAYFDIIYHRYIIIILAMYICFLIYLYAPKGLNLARKGEGKLHMNLSKRNICM